MNRVISLLKPAFFFTLFFSFVQAAQTEELPQAEWTTVSLNKEDTRGANILVALVRNADRFSKWLGYDLTKKIKGRPLKGNIYIATLKRSKSLQSKSIELKDESRLNITTSTTKYILLEEIDSKPDRMILVNEVLTSKVRTKKRKSALQKTIIDDVEVPQTDLVVSHSLSYDYPSRDVSNSLESAPNQEYIALFHQLENSKQECAEQSPGARFCKVSNVTVDLVKAASRHADEIELIVNKIKNENQFVLDPTASVSVTFDEHVSGAKIRNVEISGLIRKKNEVFETDDARSSWIIRFDNDVVPKIVQRGDTSSSQKNDFNSDATWGIK